MKVVSIGRTMDILQNNAIIPSPVRSTNQHGKENQLISKMA